METHLADFVRDTPEGRAADAVLRRCVHCGFCTATCPTYQLLGDELDGPRGRIYLIKEFLEGAPATRRTQTHLDRCLTCRNCETTCPSGVEYGRLVDIGRDLLEHQLGDQRPLQERVLRWLLREGASRRRAFSVALAVGRLVRPLLPASLAAKIPMRAAPTADRSMATRAPAHAARPRRVILAQGCVQPALAPQINRAAASVLDALGIGVVLAREERCCGALRSHLQDSRGALAEMRANIDAWCTLLDSGVEAIVSTASGCGVMIKDYGHLFADDPLYRERAQRVAAATRDIGEFLYSERERLPAAGAGARDRVAYHAPCTLAHGQKLSGQVEAVLTATGVEVLACRDSHLCCGSAGSYSILQPELANRLRENKLRALEATGAPEYVTANIGCLSHLAGAAERPVLHWIEVLDRRLRAASLRVPA